MCCKNNTNIAVNFKYRSGSLSKAMLTTLNLRNQFNVMKLFFISMQALINDLHKETPNEINNKN